MAQGNEKGQLFDTWPEKYDQWFTTPIGSLVKRVEGELLLDLLNPARGERILDAGCGTGVFTQEVLSRGSKVTGLDVSLPMLMRAKQKAQPSFFQVSAGDILSLPFPRNCFDKTISVTALEFIADGPGAVRELFRVTRPRGVIVVATLNSLSPWATRRKEEAQGGHTLFQKVIFRSPEELVSLAPVRGVTRTAVHFRKEDDLGRAAEIEKEGRRRGLNTGAFLAACWVKPEGRI
jgi:ubiquinone/menaquinone biosynthesis C-methylase UbiE